MGRHYIHEYLTPMAGMNYFLNKTAGGVVDYVNDHLYCIARLD